MNSSCPGSEQVVCVVNLQSRLVRGSAKRLDRNSPFRLAGQGISRFGDKLKCNPLQISDNHLSIANFVDNSRCCSQAHPHSVRGGCDQTIDAGCLRPTESGGAEFVFGQWFNRINGLGLGLRGAKLYVRTNIRHFACGAESRPRLTPASIFISEVRQGVKRVLPMRGAAAAMLQGLDS